MIAGVLVDLFVLARSCASIRVRTLGALLRGYIATFKGCKVFIPT